MSSAYSMLFKQANATLWTLSKCGYAFVSRETQFLQGIAVTNVKIFQQTTVVTVRENTLQSETQRILRRSYEVFASQDNSLNKNNLIELNAMSKDAR